MVRRRNLDDVPRADALRVGLGSDDQETWRSLRAALKSGDEAAIEAARTALCIGRKHVEFCAVALRLATELDEARAAAEKAELRSAAVERELQMLANMTPATVSECEQLAERFAFLNLEKQRIFGLVNNGARNWAVAESVPELFGLPKNRVRNGVHPRLHNAARELLDVDLYQTHWLTMPEFAAAPRTIRIVAAGA